MMKIFTNVALLALSLSISAPSMAGARNGYRLVFVDLSTTKKREIENHLTTYFNSDLPADTYFCQQGRRLIEFDLVYVKKRPKSITTNLIMSGVKAEKNSLKEIRKALRTYRDTEIDKGFDGLVVFLHHVAEIELTTIGAVDNGYYRSSRVNISQRIDPTRLRALFCSSLADLPYSYID